MAAMLSEARGVLNAALYSATNRIRYLHRAIRHLDRACAGARPDPLVVAALGNGLWMRYERTGDPDDLAAAVRRNRQAADAPGLDDARRAGYLADLAAPLLARGRRFGREADVEEAVACSRQAVRLAADPDVRAVALTNLAAALHARYAYTARLADLLPAVDAAREAVRLTGPGHRRRPLRLTILADTLTTRYEHTGDPGDIVAAVDAAREAAAAGPALNANTLAVALRLRFTATADPADLDDAVAAGERAVRDADPGSPDHAVFLGNLAAVRWLRFRAAGEPDDLRRAVDEAGAAIDATPAGHPNRVLEWHNLSLMLATRHAQTADPADRERSRQAARAAADGLDPADPARAMVLTQLAAVLRPDPEARTRLREAVTAAGPALTLHHALRAATELGDLAAADGDAADALLGYTRAVELLPLAAWPGVRREVREARLGDAAGLAGSAAAFAAPDRAVELLELGRSVMWTRELDRRTDLSRLRAANPALADRLTEIRSWSDRADDGG